MCFNMYSRCASPAGLVEIQASAMYWLRASDVANSAIDGYDALFAAVISGMLDAQMALRDRVLVCESMLALAGRMIAWRQASSYT